ncbi:transmembrane protein 255B [Sphaeramia orbicularis]|uniref:transmembrane protein 255B n=1 Tax=Sphaeramia orbicularis TaxID=375764 RepID=UPI001181593F|nr:transmembrane protein 255B [Sphaeramia orbicularis]
MHQPETHQNTQQTTPEILDPEVQYKRRRRAALLVTVALLAFALLVLTVGLIATTRTNVETAGYYSGIVMSFGAFLGIVGMHLVENRRPMLIASIVFISFGIIAAAFCAIIDGIIVSNYIDIRPVQQKLCGYHPGYVGYGYDSFYTEVTCRSASETCKLKVQSRTCYCCYLYNCGNSYEYHYYRFTGVNECWDVVHLYRLMWTSVVLNVFILFLGIITAALLGAYKDLEQKPTPEITSSPPPQPHILYNPNHHIPTYASFIPPGHALPAYPHYPMPMQHDPSFQAPALPPLIPDGGSVSNPQPSEETANQQATSTQPQPQGGTQDPVGYVLTPNAPILYPPSSMANVFEKPPPYAC